MEVKFCKHCQTNHELTDKYWKKINTSFVCVQRMKEKRRETQDKKMLAKYGVARPRQHKEYYQSLTPKKQQTCLERYGVTNPMYVKEFKEASASNWGTGKKKKAPHIRKPAAKKDRVLPNGLELNVFLTKYRLYPPYFNKLFTKKKAQEFLTFCQAYLHADPISILLNNLPDEVSATINSVVDNIVIPVVLKHQSKQIFVTFDEYYWLSERAYSQADLLSLHAKAEKNGAKLLNFTRADILLFLDAVLGCVRNYFNLNNIEHIHSITKMTKKDAFSFFEKNALYQYHTYTDTYAALNSSGLPILAISIKPLETELLITQAANLAGHTALYGYQTLLEDVLKYHPNLNQIKYLHDIRSVNTEILNGFAPVGAPKLSYDWTDGLQLYPKNRFSENNNINGMLKVFNIGIQKYIMNKA